MPGAWAFLGWGICLALGLKGKRLRWMADRTYEIREHAQLEGKDDQIPLVKQLARRAGAILKTEGIAGLGERVTGRLKRRPLHLRAYIVSLHLDRPIRSPRPMVEVEIDEVKATDEEALEVLAQIDEWRISKADLLRCLVGGRRCYVAKHAGQIVSSEWYILDGGLDSLFLGRRFQFAANEVFAYNAYTIPAFRGKGILPYLQAESARVVAAHNPHKTCVLALINVRNKASLRAFAKVGFTRVGQVGLMEVMGIRFHYILGQDALPATTQRFFFERM